MPPKENLERACEECIHYWACSRQCGEPMAQSSATGCECYETVKSIAAARLIEHLTAENVKADAEREALLGELRKSGCTYCKYETVCEDKPWLFIRKVCDHCGKRESCVCQTCTGDGSETDKWQWRGLQEAPEEGGKA